METKERQGSHGQAGPGHLQLMAKPAHGPTWLAAGQHLLLLTELTGPPAQAEARGTLPGMQEAQMPSTTEADRTDLRPAPPRG
jgi:hypothetical protein